MEAALVKRVAKAIDDVQLFSRFNDWTSDARKGYPVEICRYGKRDEPEIVVIKRYRAGTDESDALRKEVSRARAEAAITAVLLTYVRQLDAEIERLTAENERLRRGIDLCSGSCSYQQNAVNSEKKK